MAKKCRFSCFLSWYQVAISITTAYRRSSYEVGLLGIPQDSTTQSVHGPNMVEFKENRDSTGQGQGYQGMQRLNRGAVRSEALIYQHCTPYLRKSTASWCTIGVTSVQVLRPEGKESFKALLECTVEMKLRPVNALCTSMVIVPHGAATFMKPVKQLTGRTRKIIL